MPSDIYCPKCGEIWDIDSLHEEAKFLLPEIEEVRSSKCLPEERERLNREYEKVFKKVQHDFYAKGCSALTVMGTRCVSKPTERRKTQAAFSSALMEILGDDIDGIASELDDAEYFGLL